VKTGEGGGGPIVRGGHEDEGEGKKCGAPVAGEGEK
jgi:hypothetical protein